MAKRQKRTEVQRAHIVGLAKGGDGIGIVDSARRMTVFVPGTAPGDVVDIRLENKRGRVECLVEASVLRATPPCPHAQQCGGCDWMHISISAQRTARQAIVQQALERAGVAAANVTVHHAPRVTGYRSRARFAVQASPRGVAVGLRAARSHRIVPIDTCLVLKPALDCLLKEIGVWLKGSEGKGEASVTLGHGGLPTVHLTWRGELCPNTFADAQRRVSEGIWSGTSILLEGAKAPAVIGDPRGVTAAGDGKPLLVPAGGFMQAFEEMNQALVRHVVEIARVDDQATLELFAGSGNFTIALARHTGELETIEQDASAVDAARDNLGVRSLKARLVVGDADAVKIRKPVRVVVLDPPRSGAPGAAASLATSGARRVVMVSCDPATMARDAATLIKSGRFEAKSVDVFEMFPHTSHVETVMHFERVHR